MIYGVKLQAPVKAGSVGPRPMKVAAFAEHLVARYARRRIAARGLDLALVGVPPRLLQTIVHRYHDHRRWVQVLTTALVSCDKQASSPRERESASTLGPAPRYEFRTLSRIVERTRRIEVRIAAAPAALPNLAGSGGVVHQAERASLPLALPVVRAAVPAQAAMAASQHGRNPTAADGIANDRRSAAAPPELRFSAVPEHEMARLADRVIGSIDRRIAAQRERFGRL